MFPEPDYKPALESMVNQFAYRVRRGSPLYFPNGVLSALEEAFETLQWSDPHLIKAKGNGEVFG